jgi:hypothetical protein
MEQIVWFVGREASGSLEVADGLVNLPRLISLKTAFVVIPGFTTIFLAGLFRCHRQCSFNGLSAKGR